MNPMPFYLIPTNDNIQNNDKLLNKIDLLEKKIKILENKINKLESKYIEKTEKEDYMYMI